MHQKLPGMSWLFCSRGHIHKKSSLCPCCFARGDIYTKSLLYVPVFSFSGTYMPKVSLYVPVFSFSGTYTQKNLLHVPAVSFARTYMLKVSLYVPFYLYNRTFPATFLLYVPLAFVGLFPPRFFHMSHQLHLPRNIVIIYPPSASYSPRNHTLFWFA